MYRLFKNTILTIRALNLITLSSQILNSNNILRSCCQNLIEKPFPHSRLSVYTKLSTSENGSVLQRIFFCMQPACGQVLIIVQHDLKGWNHFKYMSLPAWVGIFLWQPCRPWEWSNDLDHVLLSILDPNSAQRIAATQCFQVLQNLGHILQPGCMICRKWKYYMGLYRRQLKVSEMGFL